MMNPMTHRGTLEDLLSVLFRQAQHRLYGASARTINGMEIDMI